MFYLFFRLVAESSTGCVLGSDALGNRNERSEETGSKAASSLLKAINSGSCLDDYCQDQVIVFMALAQGVSQIKVSEVTLHTKTAIFVAERLTEVRTMRILFFPVLNIFFYFQARFEMVPVGSNIIIKCTGIGMLNKLN